MSKINKKKAAVFAAAFYLYHLPLEAVAYPVLLCAFFGAIALCVDFRRVRARHIHLLEAVRQADYTPQPIAYTPEQMPAAPERSGYYEAADDDTQMLSLVNDRLRAQARRYPHPITNEMEAIH